MTIWDVPGERKPMVLPSTGGGVSGVNDAEVHVQVALRLLKTVQVMVGKAKELCPVDTGRLQGDIGVLGAALTVAWYGTNVEYARHVEFDTWNVWGGRVLPGRAYMRGSVWSARDTGLVKDIWR